MYVRNTVNFKICLCFSNSVCELLILKLLNPSIIIIIIYRPPSCLDCDFIDVIIRAEQYILTIPAPLPDIILLGDFNFPLINWSNPNSQCPLSSPLFNLSDHLFLSQQVANNVFDKLDFNKANWANLILAIKQIDWSTVLDPTSSTTCLIPFTDIISQICSLHTPIKGTKKTKIVSVFFIENGRS